MQQQQGARDKVAVTQQMAGSSEFQPPRRQAGAGNPAQMDGGNREAPRASAEPGQDAIWPSRDAR